MRILIIEDEKKISDVIVSRLLKDNYIVDKAYNGEDGLNKVLSDMYDLIILDVMLPKINGYDILKEIRNNNIEVKIIMLTAKSELEDKLYGFESGADDYITKPFHIDELVARVNVQLRKKNNIKNYIEFYDLRLYLNNSTLMCTKTNDTIDIVGKEYLLLEYLMLNNNQIVNKDQIYNKIWGVDNEVESNNLEAYLSFIRKKIKIIGSNVIIKAKRGMGYKLEVLDEKTKI